MASVWCLCGAKLWDDNSDNPRQMAALCESCLTTKDCRKSPYWTTPPPPKAAKTTTFKTKDTVETKPEWTKSKGGKHDGYRVGR